ncbi:MAG: glycosyltransferase family 4 protein [Gemmatimonadaceae bacterium]
MKRGTGPENASETSMSRVLLVSFIANNRWTGMGQWSNSVGEELRLLGHEIDWWFAEDFAGMRRLGRLAVLAFPIVLAVRLVRERRRFDAVIVHEPSALWYALLRRVSRTLPPLVLMCHNVESEVFRDLENAAALGLARVSHATRLRTRLFRIWQSDGAIRLADHVVCLSSRDRAEILGRLRRRAEDVTRLTNGTRRSDHTSGHRSLDGHRILFVGGWLDIKGRRTLPIIWREMRKVSPHATLTLLGTGVEADRILPEFAPADRASVTVIPRLEQQDKVTALYDSHDAFVMPSLSEGCPLALLDAMAAGIPIVAARVGGIPDVVRHEANGLLFDALLPSDGAEALRRILTDSPLAARLAAAAREDARLLTWRATARSLEVAVLTTIHETAVAAAKGRQLAASHAEWRESRDER